MYNEIIGTLGVLTITSGEMKGTTYYIADGQSMIIGRGKDADIRLPESYSHVSRQHCVIAYDGIRQRFYVSDMSSHGILNSGGHHLNKEGYVRNGETLYLGDQRCGLHFSVTTAAVGNIAAKTGSLHQYGTAVRQQGNLYNGTEQPGYAPSARKKSYAGLVVLCSLLAASLVVGIILFRMHLTMERYQRMLAYRVGGWSIDEKDTEIGQISEEEREQLEEKAARQEEEKQIQDTQNDTQKEIGTAVDKHPDMMSERYYYNTLTVEGKEIYEALAALAEYPDKADVVAYYQMAPDYNVEEVATNLGCAYYALLYDHPNLFWMYNQNMVSIDIAEDNENNILYMKFDRVYTDFQTQQEIFQKAADDFLSDINLNQSEAEIALAIHDKLVDTVTYDFEEAEAGLQSDAWAHTAYAALVENGKNQANYAVCDGYAQAYVYLLREAGIDAVMLLGNAGSSEKDLTGHAWSCVYLDGEWYEVDSTWDDFQNEWHYLDELSESDKKIMKEMLEDREYSDKMEHYMYNLTTAEIENYQPEEGEFVFECSDGRTVELPMESIRHRADIENYNVVGYIWRWLQLRRGPFTDIIERVSGVFNYVN